MCTVDWGSVADWFAAIGTIAAVVVALYQARRGSNDLRAQLRHQARLERARTEEQQLNRALTVIHEGYAEALIYGSVLESELGKRQTNVAYDEATSERRKNAMRSTARAYLDRYRAFDQQLHSSEAVLKALGRQAEADAIAAVRLFSEAVFDEVTAKPESYIGEDTVAVAENTKALKDATDRASTVLSERLAELYRDLYAVGDTRTGESA